MRTRNWLINKRKELNLNQEQFAELIKVDLEEIKEIENGDTLGSLNFWKVVRDYFKYPKYAYESNELLEELESDIEEFGEEHECVLMYKEVDNHIIFTNYDFIVEEESIEEVLEDNEKYIITTFKYAYEMLEYINEVI